MRLPPLVLGGRQIQASRCMQTPSCLAADVSGLQRIVDASAAWWPSRLKSPAIRPIEMIFYLNRPLDDGVISERDHEFPINLRLGATYQRDTPTAASRSARDRSVSPIASLMSGTTSPPAR
jgi:hypothetical protein